MSAGAHQLANGMCLFEVQVDLSQGRYEKRKKQKSVSAHYLFCSTYDGFCFKSIACKYVKFQIVDGLAHTEDIVELVFNYIGLLKNTDLQKWVFEEIKNIDNIKFRFKVRSGKLWEQ